MYSQFLKSLVKRFYDELVNNAGNFDDSIENDLKDLLSEESKNTKEILEFMQNHENREIWFSSIIGFFYQYGIGCEIDKDKSLELYLLAIKRDEFQYINNIIAKYLLALFYYKVIDLDKRSSNDWNLLRTAQLIDDYIDTQRHSENLKELKGIIINSLEFIKLKGKDIKESHEQTLNVDDPEALRDLGLNKNEKRAFEYYLKSAKGGNSNSQFNLGESYYYGIGTDKDEKKAFESYLKSAKGENSDAQYQLGHFYEYGIATIKNEVQSLDWYLRSARGGNSIAQYKLGYFYECGIGLIKNDIQSFQWYLKSAEGGNIYAQYRLGYFYQYGIATIQNEVQSFEWYMKSAEGGNPIAQYQLGYRYQYGIGTVMSKILSFEWYLKSAKGGNIIAQFQLGNYYKYGIGTSKNEKKAFKWYLKSAIWHSGSQNSLGDYYAKGIVTAKDEKKAFEYYLKSANDDNYQGQYNVGKCYQFGIGIKMDIEEAINWYKKASEYGSLDAKNTLNSSQQIYQHVITKIKSMRNK